MKFKLIIFLCSFISIFNNNCMNIDQVNIYDIQSVLAFLNDGNYVDSIDRNGDSLLIIAARTGRVDIVEMLIQRGANVNFENINSGLTPLHYAVSGTQPSEEIVKLLLDNKADPNHPNQIAHLRPLHAAVIQRNWANPPEIDKIIKLLLERRADPRLLDSDALKPSDYVRSEDKALKELLKKAEQERDLEDLNK